MADIERTLLAKAIQTGEFNNVVARGIESEHFADPECQEIFDFSLDFTREHAQAPSFEIVKKEFRKFKPPLSTDPLSYHMEQFVLKVKERTAIELVRGYNDAIDDPEQLANIEIHAMEMTRALADLVPTPRAKRFSEGESRIAEYRRKQAAGENTGLMLGIPSLDNEMLGVQPHEFVVIAAYLGMGKSTLMKYFAYSFYLQGKTSLIVSLEEEGDAVLRKLDVMASNVKYHAMKALELGQGDIEMWKKIAERAHEDRHEKDIIVVDDIAHCSVDHIYNQVLRYSPDCVMVDYLELMKPPRSAGSQSSWESISSNGIGLKQMARILKVPCITAAQLNRDGGKGDVTLGSVSHQSVGKHSDVLIGLTSPEGVDEGGDQQEMDLILLKNRDGRKTRCTLRWILERMDIGEKGVEERFKRRDGKKSMIGSERRAAERLERKRNIGDRNNPFSGKRRESKTGHKKKSGAKNPFPKRVKV